MKYITYLVMCLVMLLAAPVVWAGQAGQTVDMPEYFGPDIVAYASVKDPTCRDVFASNQTLIIYKSTSPQKQSLSAKTRIWAGNQTLIPNGDGFTHKEAAVLMGKAEFLGWQSADTVVFAKRPYGIRFRL